MGRDRQERYCRTRPGVWVMIVDESECGASSSAPTMRERVRDYDWATTSLGTMADWPQSLRTAVDMMLASGVPMCIYWGPERIQFYNDAFAPILGPRHPGTLG